MSKEIQKVVKLKLPEELTKYIKKKHNQDRCNGFIDGFEKACELILNADYTQKNHDICNHD